jgi:hypothetical protein
MYCSSVVSCIATTVPQSNEVWLYVPKVKQNLNCFLLHWALFKYMSKAIQRFLAPEISEPV